MYLGYKGSEIKSARQVRAPVSVISRHPGPTTPAGRMVFGVIYLATNLVVDILYAYIDPRVRYG